MSVLYEVQGMQKKVVRTLFSREKTVCKQCCYKKQKCDVCGVHYRSDLFSENSLENYIKHKTRLLCRQCIDKGYTLRETTIYRCVHGCRYGKEKFRHRQLSNYQHRGGSLTCIDCQTREKRIQDKLNKEEAWRCTCRKPFGHDSTCQLYPTNPNEKRWPGKNVSVPEDDWLFLSQSAKYQNAKRQRKILSKRRKGFDNVCMHCIDWLWWERRTTSWIARNVCYRRCAKRITDLHVQSKRCPWVSAIGSCVLCGC